MAVWVIMILIFSLSESRIIAVILRSIFLTCFLLTLGVNPLFSQLTTVEPPKFTQVENLSGVWTMMKDSRGFMWFGTHEGLVRYDGVESKIFYPDSSDSTKLSQGNVHHLFEDNRGAIWVVAGIGLFNRRTIHVYNPSTEMFTKIAVNPLLNGGYLGDVMPKVQNLFLEDFQGNIWIKCYTNGLYRINTTNNTYEVTNYRHSSGSQDSHTADSVSVLFLDSQKRIWVGTRDGLFQFHQESEEFIRYPFNRLIHKDEVTGIIEDDQGFLWLNYNNFGLVSLNPENGKVVPKWSKSSNSDYWFLNRRFMLKDRLGNLWMMNHDIPEQFGDSGLDRFNMSTGETSEYFQLDLNDPKTHEFGNLKTLLDGDSTLWVQSDSALYFFNQQTELFEKFVDLKSLGSQHVFAAPFIDDHGNIWLNDVTTGIFKYNSSNQKFPLLFPHKVGGVTEDQDNNIWIGGDGGLFKYNYTTDRQKIDHAEHVLEFEYCEEPFFDSSGNIWVSCHTEEYRYILNKLDANGDHIISYQHDPNDSESLNLQSRKLTELANGKILITTYGYGLDYLDPSTGKVKRFLHDDSDPFSISDNIWTEVMVDDEEKVWVVNQKSIEIFDVETERFIKIDTTAGETFGLVHDLFKDSEGIFWIAGGYGLFRYDPIKFKIEKKYTVQDGLPSNDLRQVIEDDVGYLWISSRKGLVRFDKNQELFQVYDTSDGLPSANFADASVSSGVCFKTSGGKLMFASVSGLVFFDPDKLPMNRVTTQPIITELLLHNQPVIWSVAKFYHIVSHQVNNLHLISIKI